jgi:hypothetical protein
MHVQLSTYACLKPAGQRQMLTLLLHHVRPAGVASVSGCQAASRVCWKGHGERGSTGSATSFDDEPLCTCCCSLSSCALLLCCVSSDATSGVSSSHSAQCLLLLWHQPDDA